MSGYRFHQLRDNPRQGVLQRVGYGSAIAEFLTPEQAKAMADIRTSSASMGERK